MLKEKIKQLKTLLEEMDDPTPREFNTITAEFNRYKRKHNTNNQILISHEELIFFIADKYRDFEFLRQLRDGTQNPDIRTAAGGAQLGYFVEMIKVIYRHDIFGWHYAGFDITREEMEILEDMRHTKFHIPEDTELFVERSHRFTQLDRIFEITMNNSTSLKKYMDYQQIIYPAIQKMLENAFATTRSPFFLNDSYPIKNLSL
jgi:hypothetical protein